MNENRVAIRRGMCDGLHSHLTPASVVDHCQHHDEARKQAKEVNCA